MVRAELLQHLASHEGKEDIASLVEPIFSGTIAYRGLIPVDKMPKNLDGSLHRTINSPMMVRYSIHRVFGDAEHFFNSTVGRAR